MSGMAVETIVVSIAIMNIEAMMAATMNAREPRADATIDYRCGGVIEMARLPGMLPDHSVAGRIDPNEAPAYCLASGGNQMMSRLVAGCFLLLMLCANVHAGDCLTDQSGKMVCGAGQCAADQYGKIFCAKAGGGAMRNQYGEVMCGVGFCAVDDNGQVKCSTQAGGGAATDSNGKVKCLGSCQDASPRFCEAAR